MLEDYLDALLTGPDPETLRIGLVVPGSGVMGLTGPAGIAAAVLAAEEANALDGPGRRAIRLVPLDAGTGAAQVDAQVAELVCAGVIDGLCGFHTSDVFRRLQRVTTGRVPYLFTPPHEGGRMPAGVALLDDGPPDQLRPVIDALAGRAALRRWALIGNDYVWPRAVHRAARPMLATAGSDVVLERLVPFHQVNPERLLDELAARRVQAVLLSLVGRDLATFNRAFTATRLGGSVVRVSGALEETGLLEIEGDDTGELYATMSWFATDPADDGFRERYIARWGTSAPQLGSYARGCYHGVHAMAELAASGLLTVDGIATGLRRLPRRSRSRLARADGLDLLAVG